MRLVIGILILIILPAASALRAQESQPVSEPDAAGSTPHPWMFMYDGVLYGTYNNQGGARGGEELISTNWVMGMASRTAGPGQLTLVGMMSAEPATVGPEGYRELFQVGESYHFLPIIDHQHPHDLLMQAAAVWRLPLDDRTHITFAGAPVGEPALGPVAFMHRRSAAENPTAPLGHHTFDSTHIAMGVITAAVDRGPWTWEGSIFQSTEPDENRWDLVDFGALDSWSARVWYEPSSRWQFQASTGYLAHPERLEFQSVFRTTASASWLRTGEHGYTAVTAMAGHNQKSLDGGFTALLAEATHRRNAWSVYGRGETLQVETLVLQTGSAFHSHTMPTPKDVVTAGTAGLVWDLPSWRGFEVGFGGDATFYAVPDALRPYYGSSPVSAHVFVRVRPPAGHMGRMWNMRMARPSGH
ncbi:MAG TPA: hypothetical protein VH417_17300 [Vicinamibacterales bacterium]